MSKYQNGEHVLCINCIDRPGIVAAVSCNLRDQGCNIEESAQFFDRFSGHFFMRVLIRPYNPGSSVEKFAEAFAPEADALDMRWALHDSSKKVNALIMVSREDHCLNDILYRWKTGHLPINITAVVSNHENNRQTVEERGLKFIHLPATKENKLEQEEKLTEIIKETRSELVVLARYMQILSDKFCEEHQGRIINIHHSFLPSFKGAKPYHQAYERGVKIIGATAHFATADLDEGPIIEQETIRIDHTKTPEKLQILGKDIETRVLSRAILYFAERRIFLQDKRTILL